MNARDGLPPDVLAAILTGRWRSSPSPPAAVPNVLDTYFDRASGAWIGQAPRSWGQTLPLDPAPPSPPPAPPSPPAPPPEPEPAPTPRLDAIVANSLREGLGAITIPMLVVAVFTGAAFAIGSGFVSRYVWRTP